MKARGGIGRECCMKYIFFLLYQKLRAWEGTGDTRKRQESTVVKPPMLFKTQGLVPAPALTALVEGKAELFTKRSLMLR